MKKLFFLILGVTALPFALIGVGIIILMILGGGLILTGLIGWSAFRDWLGARNANRQPWPVEIEM
jgi:hypothetical protein